MKLKMREKFPISYFHIIFFFFLSKCMWNIEKPKNLISKNLKSNEAKKYLILSILRKTPGHISFNSSSPIILLLHWLRWKIDFSGFRYGIPKKKRRLHSYAEFAFGVSQITLISEGNIYWTIALCVAIHGEVSNVAVPIPSNVNTLVVDNGWISSHLRKIASMTIYISQNLEYSIVSTMISNWKCRWISF